MAESQTERKQGINSLASNDDDYHCYGRRF